MSWEFDSSTVDILNWKHENHVWHCPTQTLSKGTQLTWLSTSSQLILAFKTVFWPYHWSLFPHLQQRTSFLILVAELSNSPPSVGLYIATSHKFWSVWRDEEKPKGYDRVKEQKNVTDNHQIADSPIDAWKHFLFSVLWIDNWGWGWGWWRAFCGLGSVKFLKRIKEKKGNGRRVGLEGGFSPFSLLVWVQKGSRAFGYGYLY